MSFSADATYTVMLEKASDASRGLLPELPPDRRDVILRTLFSAAGILPHLRHEAALTEAFEELRRAEINTKKWFGENPGGDRRASVILEENR